MNTKNGSGFPNAIKLAKLEARRDHLAKKIYYLDLKIAEIKYPEADWSELDGWVVYLLQSGEFYKIGCAANMQERISALQTGNPLKLRLIDFIRCKSKTEAEQLETRLHKIFSVKNVSGEWFKLSDVDICKFKDVRSDRIYPELFGLNQRRSQKLPYKE